MYTDKKRTIFFPASKLLLAFAFFAAAATARCQGIRDRPFKDIDGNAVKLAGYAGTKVLFIVLPANGADSFAAQLKTFVSAYGSKVKVVGVLSQEGGEGGPDKAVLKAAYNNTGILLTEAMASRKGNGQSPLMEWLTDKKENGHFDTDVEGPGQKFFVDGRGRLYAVLGPKAPLSSPFIARVLDAPEQDDKPAPVKGKTNP